MREFSLEGVFFLWDRLLVRPRPNYPALEYLAAAVLLLEAPSLVRCESLQQFMPQLQEGVKELDVAVVWELTLALWREHEPSRYEDMQPESPPVETTPCQEKPSLLRKLFQRHSKKAAKGESRASTSVSFSVTPSPQPSSVTPSPQPSSAPSPQPSSVAPSPQPTLETELSNGPTTELQQMEASGVHQDAESIFTKYFHCTLYYITLFKNGEGEYTNSKQINNEHKVGITE